jgi:hypothetical protein
MPRWISMISLNETHHLLISHSPLLILRHSQTLWTFNKELMIHP